MSWLDGSETAFQKALKEIMQKYDMDISDMDNLRRLFLKGWTAGWTAQSNYDPQWDSD